LTFLRCLPEFGQARKKHIWKKGISLASLKRLTSVLLCFLLSPLSVLAADVQHAGQINALIPAATRNDKTTKVKDDLDWNDLLKTQQNGRVRAGLNDGSILSVGSNSELRVVQHDAASQQTSLEMSAGRLRSRVVKITQPNGKFEVRTPNAVIGVIGTDFYVKYANGKTTVVCYSGQVSVTALGGAQALQKDSSSGSGSNSVLVAAGQMVEITSEVPPGGFASHPTPLEEQQESIASTEVPDMPPPVTAGVAHPWHWILLVGGFTGLATGLVFATTQGSTKTVPTRPGTQCPPGTPPQQCP
jgi:hypothetical protein